MADKGKKPLYKYSDEEQPKSNVGQSTGQVGENLATYSAKATLLREKLTEDENGKYSTAKRYPTTVPSLFGWVAENVQEGSQYYEIISVAVGELLSPFIRWLPVLLVIGMIRADSGLVTNLHRLTPLFLTVLGGSALSHIWFHRLSCDANPTISIARYFLPDSYSFPMKYRYGKMENWTIATAILITKLVANFVSSLIIVMLASELEVTGNLGFPDLGGFYTSSGFPYIYGTGATAHVRAGSLLFLASFIETATFLAMHLEFVKVGKESLKSLYIGIGSMVATLISYQATSSPLNPMLALCTMMYHGKSSDQPHATFLVPTFIGAGFAAAAWYLVVRVTSIQKPPKLD